jgi:hypothetical protein
MEPSAKPPATCAGVCPSRRILIKLVTSLSQNIRENSGQLMDVQYVGNKIIVQKVFIKQRILDTCRKERKEHLFAESVGMIARDPAKSL